MTFVRITKRQAKALFDEGKPFALCPRKMMPGGPWAMHTTIFPDSYKAASFVNDPWAFMLRQWVWYNASWETGYYPHYYVEV